ncbi:MAG TPA: metallophosphoesterase [Pyrinomonadaceae bacterium]|nr:metallophosphoesterase [Pyrinomonadaceae bacterium]
MPDQLNNETDNNDLSRRSFMKCMAWGGAGVLWVMNAGVLTSCSLLHASVPKGKFSFVQISDSHIGFNKAPNPDATKTFTESVAQINALPQQPSFLIHTGDISHLSTPEQFDTATQILKSAKPNQVYFVPGEHDVFTDEGKTYFEKFGKGTQGNGWQSFDYDGVHFIGLVNVLNLKEGSGTGLGGSGLGQLGSAQLEWLEKDVKGLSSSTPIVVFAHIPLWTIYPEWGWGTEDSAQALSYLKRFGSITVLNGHIHQILQKVEGNVTFHTARSTAFPQPAPGAAPSPGPIKDVPADKLRSLLGLSDVTYVANDRPLALIDSTLA